MAMTIHVDVVSAEESLFSGLVEFAAFPGEAGELGVLPNHTPLLTRIKPGTIRLKTGPGDQFETLYVSGGMLEIQPHMITVLADTAVRAAELDEAKLLEARRHAEEALAKRGVGGDVNFAAAEAELAQLNAQLQAIKRLKNQVH